MTTAHAPAARPYSTGRSVWLVAQREIMVRLRSVAFLVSTGLMLVLLLGSIVVSALVSANAPDPKVAVVAGAALRATGRGLGSGIFGAASAGTENATASARHVAKAVDRNAAARTVRVTAFLRGESFEAGPAPALFD